MKPFCLLVFAAGVAAADAAEYQFEPPVRLKGGDAYVRVESPGWACPSLADIDGDGKKDLLVGQFNRGKIKVYKGLGGGRFAAGEWLKAQGDVAEVPGVW
ncbi:MAG: VCBS repeat-containing protein [Verrucomicrobia bacterium]|nr:VCBS repeat-containing protein [Verrucomicrobiota bacterium]